MLSGHVWNGNMRPCCCIRLTRYGNPGSSRPTHGHGLPRLPHCRLTSFILHLLSVRGQYRKFEIATLADFLCCCWIWIGQSLLPSSRLEFESLLKVQVAWSFSHICQVAPTAQEWACHAGLCHAFLVLSAEWWWDTSIYIGAVFSSYTLP